MKKVLISDINHGVILELIHHTQKKKFGAIGDTHGGTKAAKVPKF